MRRLTAAQLFGVLFVVLVAAGVIGYVLIPTGTRRRDAGTVPPVSRVAGTSIPPAPVQPSGRVFHTPAGIAANCSRDVTAVLNAWIAAVPDNSTLEFPARACYEIEGSLFVNDRHHLLFDGNGAEFLAKTTGAGTRPPPGQQHLSWPTARAQWWIMRGTDITLENMVIHGAAGVEAPYEGTNWGSRAVRRQYIGQYGVRFAGTDGGLLEGCTITDTFSDLVGVTADDPALRHPLPARNITIEHDVLERSDRDGPSVYDGTNIMIADNTISDVWGPVVDLEPVATRWEVDNVTVADNKVGTHAHYFITAAGASATNDNLLFKGNVVTGGNMMILVGSRSSPPPIRQNVQIIDNRANRPNTAGGSLISAGGIDHLVVSSNRSPVVGTAVSLRDSTNVDVALNAFTGASAVVSARGSSAISQSHNSD